MHGLSSNKKVIIPIEYTIGSHCHKKVEMVKSLSLYTFIHLFVPYRQITNKWCRQNDSFHAWIWHECHGLSFGSCFNNIPLFIYLPCELGNMFYDSHIIFSLFDFREVILNKSTTLEYDMFVQSVHHSWQMKKELLWINISLYFEKNGKLLKLQHHCLWEP